MLGGFGIIDPADIRGSTRTTAGTLATIPAGKYLTANVILSASVSVAGNSNPTVSVAGSSSTPSAGVLARLNVTGLALTTVCDSVETEILVYADSGDVTIEFTPGASGVSSASLNGFIFG